MKNFLIALLLFLTNFNLIAQIQNGPMIGYVQEKEVALWVQTTKNEDVQFALRLVGEKKWTYTQVYKTKEADAFVCQQVVEKLKPAKKYEYRVVINGHLESPIGPQIIETQASLKIKQKAVDFAFAVGSCAYINEEGFDRPGKPYGGDYQIFDAVYQSSPKFVMWLGDNIYFRNADLTTRSAMTHRYSYSRALPELQKLLANIPQYAIWDDHDFGPNDSDGNFEKKTTTKELFELFWANPAANNSNLQGITTQFEWSDCQFFLLDNRYERSAISQDAGVKTILGPTQLDWLKSELLQSKATFKFVAIGGQFLNTAPVFENYAANGFDKERQEIIDFIYQYQIKNVVFLTGDRHHSELSVLNEMGKPIIYDLTVSPLTSGVHDALNEANALRVDGSHIAQRNFGVLKVEGAFKARVLSIEIKDATGTTIWETKINQAL
ncbi:MAG: alkaline phosphatase D family protein [Flavobacteriales bacterium]